MIANDPERDARNTLRFALVASGVAITEKGLVCGDTSILARMTRSADGRTRPALDIDGDRIIALLSVVKSEPVARADILPPIQAAVAHWERGDKALANLRLIFAGLPSPADQSALHRLSLATDVLDGGMPPDRLMKALWPITGLGDLRKYNPDQPRVPAGSGRRSGEWDFGGGDAAFADLEPAGRIVVAEDDKVPLPGESAFGESKLTDKTEEEEGRAHPIPVNPLAGGPAGSAGGLSGNVDAGLYPGGSLPVGTGTPGPSRAADVAALASAALEAVGPGSGPVHGTKVHTELATRIQRLEDPDLHAEQSYLNGQLVTYGRKGSVRADIAAGSVDRPHTVYDLKTGGARLSQSKIEQYRLHVPNGNSLIIREQRR